MAHEIILAPNTLTCLNQMLAAHISIYFRYGALCMKLYRFMVSIGVWDDSFNASTIWKAYFISSILLKSNVMIYAPSLFESDFHAFHLHHNVPLVLK